jgi:16S rRNA (cytosine967-C5)-methyltransferase
MILSIGIAQLRWMDRIPPSAAVDEAVEQAKRLRLGKASGFINAVLRRASREPDLNLPDRDNPQEYARLVLSCPPEVFQRMVRQMGVEKALSLCEKNNEQAPLIVRVSSDEWFNQLPTPVQIQKHQIHGSWVVTGATESDLRTWAEQGLAQVQDPTASQVVPQLKLEPGHWSLDRCAGVGTKTLQIAQLVGHTGRVIAVDPSTTRIQKLNHLIRVRHLTWVQTYQTGMLETLTLERPFDRILVDVPCSNSGVLIRRPEARYHQDDTSLQSLIRLQRRILSDTLAHLCSGGLLVYSTCSIWTEENESQVEWILRQTDRLELVDTRQVLPSLDPDPTRHHDGGFWAVFRSR